MRKVFLFTLVFALSICQLYAQQYIDVLYLKNGSIIKGIILEQVPNQTLKIQTADKSLFVYKMDEVEKILKEETSTQATSTYSDGSGLSQSSYSISLKCGLLLNGPGKISIGNGETKAKVSPLVKADIDGILVPKLSMGISGIFGLLNVERYNKSSSYFSIGGTIKPRFILNEDVQVRPGLFIGYNYINNDDMNNNSDGLNVGFQLELSKYFQSGQTFVGEFGFISQPVGGTGDIAISFAPIFYILVGIQFGR
jgi:hypothetical protein